MKNFYQYMKERDIEVPKKEISGSWFSKHGFPMVVRCSCCDMTMALPSAWIDDEGYTFCGNCANIKEE